jgi:hypothetical protein
MSVGFVYKLDKFSIEDTKLWAKKMKDKAKPIKKEPEIEVTPN